MSKRISEAEWIARFKARRHINERGCWEYTGRINQLGYGEVTIHCKTTRVHRAYWMLTVNPNITSDIHICHHCDNRRCFNPEHLYEGNAVTNTQDKMRRGRNNFRREVWGEKNHAAKLTNSKVKRIRKLALTQSQASLASEFGVSSGLISQIVNRKLWPNV